MGTVWERGRKLWIKFKDASGTWRYSSSGYEVGQEGLARALLDEVEAEVRERLA